jgi:hypothetical protein
VHVEQLSWTRCGGWTPNSFAQSKPDLILCFGSRKSLAAGLRLDQLMCAGASIVGCTAGGQILDHDRLHNQTMTMAVTAITEAAA